MVKEKEKLQARLEGDNVIIHKDSFMRILNCLADQKSISEQPKKELTGRSGALMYKRPPSPKQKEIDSIYIEAIKIIHHNRI